MYKVKKTGYVIDNDAYHRLVEKTLRITYESRLWKIWRAIVTPGTCYYCASMNGKYSNPNCKCYIESLSALVAGTATDTGVDGVDFMSPFTAFCPITILHRQKQGKRDGISCSEI